MLLVSATEGEEAIGEELEAEGGVGEAHGGGSFWVLEAYRGDA